MITRELEQSVFYRTRVPRLAKQIAVFTFVSFTWIFFRAGSLPDALLIVNRVFTAAWVDPQIPALMLGLVAIIWPYQFLYESNLRTVLQTAPVRVGPAVLMILSPCLAASGRGAFIPFLF